MNISIKLDLSKEEWLELCSALMVRQKHPASDAKAKAIATKLFNEVFEHGNQQDTHRMLIDEFGGIARNQ